MADITKKTRHTYVLELSEEEMRVLSNVFYRVQLAERGPGKIASNIFSEVEKYVYVDEFDPEGRSNWIQTWNNMPGAIYWDEPPQWSRY